MLINLIAHIESEQNCNSLKWSFKRWRAQGLGIYPNWALFDYDLNEEKNWRLIERGRWVVSRVMRKFKAPQNILW